MRDKAIEDKLSSALLTFKGLIGEMPYPELEKSAIRKLKKIFYDAGYRKVGELEGPLDEELREEFKKYYTDKQMEFPEEYFEIITGIIAIVRQATVNAIKKQLGVE